MNSFPKKLMDLRKYYGLSQNYLAEYLEIDVIEYMGYENGRSVPCFNDIKKLAKLFRVSVDEMFDNRAVIPFLQDKEKVSKDKSNFNYLTKQSKKQKWSDGFKKNKKIIMLITASLLVIIVASVLLISYLLNGKQIINEMSGSSQNRLDASNTSVVYVNGKGIAYGRGDNSNGQLDFAFDQVFKIQEGSNFTVVLKEDGTIASVGLISQYADEIKEWRDLVDVEVGKSHILALDKYGKVWCTGDNSYGQCDFEKTEGIKKIFASDNASFIVDSEGSLYYAGSIVNTDILNDAHDLTDIEVNNKAVAYVDGGNVVYYGETDYEDIASWQHIVNVELGDDYIAAIDDNGKVYIATENETMKLDAENWTDIIAIAGGYNYLVAYDGENIYGTGENIYDQFDKAEIVKKPLSQVTNVSVAISEPDQVITISFDAVENATAYKLTYEGEAIDSTTTSFTIPFDKLEDGKAYDFVIIAVGNEYYEDSIPLTTQYTFRLPDPEITIKTMVGMSEQQFIDYMSELGVTDFNGFYSEGTCAAGFSEPTVLRVEGLTANEVIKKSQLATLKVKYYVCTVEGSEQ